MNFALIQVSCWGSKSNNPAIQCAFRFTILQYLWLKKRDLRHYGYKRTFYASVGPDLLCPAPLSRFAVLTLAAPGYLTELCFSLFLSLFEPVLYNLSASNHS